MEASVTKVQQKEPNFLVQITALDGEGGKPIKR